MMSCLLESQNHKVETCSPRATVPFTPKVNTQTHFVFSKCAAARRRAMCEIHMYGQRTFGAVPILNLSLGAPKCDHV